MNRTLAAAAQGLVTWLDTALSALALGCFFLPWHVVHDVQGGFFSSDPPHETGLTSTCTGLSHYDGSFVIPGLLATSLLVRVFTRTSRPAWALLVQLGLSAAIVVYVIQVELLKHLFDRVETLPAENTFTVALLALILSAALSLGYRTTVFVRRIHSRSDGS